MKSSLEPMNLPTHIVDPFQSGDMGSELKYNTIKTSDNTVVQVTKPCSVVLKHLFECRYCEKVFVEKQALATHENKNHLNDMKSAESVQLDSAKSSCFTGEGPDFQCRHLNCEKLFMTKQALLKHECRKHSVEKPLKCHHCDKRFNFKHHLVNHLRHHCKDVEKPLKCHHCDKKFNFKHHLVNHLRHHCKDVMSRNKALGQSAQSNYHRSIFQAKQALPKNQEKHTGEQQFKCQYYGEDLMTQNVIGGKPFECKDSQEALPKNLDIKNTSEQPFKCQYCEENLMTKKALAKHHCTKLMHVMCGEPIEYYYSQEALPKYLDIKYTTEQPFKCQYCDENLMTKKALAKHHCTKLMHVMRGEPIEYDYSQEALPKNLDIKYTTEQPFKCQYCGENLITHKALAKHHCSKQMLVMSRSGEPIEYKYSQEALPKNLDIEYTSEQPFKCLILWKKLNEKT
jgi:KRAB domain-containing zinc finger protein